MVVEGTLGHPGALDDRAPIGSREPDLSEHLDRGVENLSPCRFRSNLAGHRLLPPEFRLCALSFRTLAIATILTRQRSLTGPRAGSTDHRPVVDLVITSNPLARTYCRSRFS